MSDPMDFVYRAQAVQVRMDQVFDRGKDAARVGDIEAVAACERESSLLLDNLREIRLEQLEAQRNGYRDADERGRRWWQFWRTA